MLTIFAATRREVSTAKNDTVVFTLDAVDITELVPDTAVWWGCGDCHVDVELTAADCSRPAPTAQGRCVSCGAGSCARPERRRYLPSPPPEASAGSSVSGSTEQGEQRRGVEERVEADDAAVRDLDHLQRPGRVPPAFLRAVLAERGRTVRDRRQQPGPRQPIPQPSSHCRMLSFPRIHSGYGGIDRVASSASSAVSESRS